MRAERVACLAGAAVTLLTPAPAAAEGRVDVPAQANGAYLPAPAVALGPIGFLAGRGIGDFNGDGYDDIAIGGGPEATGSIIVLGGRRTGQVEPGRSAARTVTVAGAGVVGPAGDANGDGIDDLLATSPDASEVFVVFGRRSQTPANVDVRALGADGYRIRGGTADTPGAAVAAAGDVNRDGRGDLVLAAIDGQGNGYAAVVFGQKQPATVDLTALGAAGYRIENVCAGYYANGDGDNYSEGPLAATVAGVGDVNRDGYADVAVGTGRDDYACGAKGGLAQVFFGKSDVRPLDAAAAQIRGLRITGPAGTGGYVVGGADLNGDRRPDLVVSTANGATVLLDPPRKGVLDVRKVGRRGYAIRGTGDVGYTPISVLGDVNGDSLADLSLGDRVLFSRRSRRTRRLTRLGSGGYRALLSTSNAAGFSIGTIAPAGDVNGDSRADILVLPSDLGPDGVYLVRGNGPPLVEVAPFRSRILVDRTGRARVRMLCPANTIRRCRGRMNIRTRRDRTLVRRRFNLIAGATGTLTAKLPRSAARLLSRGLIVNATATTSARDAKGRRAVTRRDVAFQASAAPR